MNIKGQYSTLFVVILSCILIANQGCSKYNVPDPLEFAALKPKVGSPEYYEALRAYKKSDHSVCFGWWGRSGVTDLGPDMANRYEGLPDSMDIVSLWGGFPKPGTPVWKEMQQVRKIKGTRFVLVMWAHDVVNLMKKNDSLLFQVQKDTMSAIDNVTRAINDTIEKYQLDGFDLDYEQDYGDATMFGDTRGRGVSPYTTDDPHMQRLYKGLSRYMGPQSGTWKLLIIDGQFDLGIEPYIDYLAQQAYNSRDVATLQGRFNNFGGGVLPGKKFIATENMQQNGGRGGSFTYNGVDIGSVLGMAYWNPTQGRKGGFGAYIIESDVLSNPSQGLYYYLRTGIQIQNPAPGPR